jgi:hypothetical protein
MQAVRADAIPVGTSFANVTYSPEAVVQMIPPSANLNGIIVRTLLPN